MLEISRAGLDIGVGFHDGTGNGHEAGQIAQHVVRSLEQCLWGSDTQVRQQGVEIRSEPLSFLRGICCRRIERALQDLQMRLRPPGGELGAAQELQQFGIDFAMPICLKHLAGPQITKPYGWIAQGRGQQNMGGHPGWEQPTQHLILQQLFRHTSMNIEASP